MKIKINGKEEDIAGESLLLPDLLSMKNVESPEMVSVQLNGDFVERDQYTTTKIKNNDEVEFLYFMGGGGNHRTLQ